MRGTLMTIAIGLAATPAFAADIYPATGSVLPPQPSIFVEGTTELTLNVTSNDRLVPYSVVPTEMAGIVRVDVALTAGPLRIGHDDRGVLGEYVVAEPMPHRLRIENIDELVTDAALLRVVYGDGPAAAMAPTERMQLIGRVPQTVYAVWSDRTEQLVIDNRPRGCGAVPWYPPPSQGGSSRPIALALLGVLAGLALMPRQSRFVGLVIVPTAVPSTISTFSS